MLQTRDSRARGKHPSGKNYSRLFFCIGIANILYLQECCRFWRAFWWAIGTMKCGNLQSYKPYRLAELCLGCSDASGDFIQGLQRYAGTCYPPLLLGQRALCLCRSTCTKAYQNQQARANLNGMAPNAPASVYHHHCSGIRTCRADPTSLPDPVYHK